MPVSNVQPRRPFYSSLLPALSPSRRSLPFVLLLALSAAGCRREQISVYRIPKESDIPGAAASAPVAAPAQVKYQTPVGWTEQPPTGVNVASFSLAADQAQVSIMSFPREGVTQLNLINIIREKSKLPPLSDAEVAKLVEPVSIGNEKGQLLDLSAVASISTNAAPSISIVVAVLEHGGSTWFFKLAGAPDVVQAQKPALRDFLKTVSFTTGSALPPGHGQPQVASANDKHLPAQSTPALAPPPSVDKPAWEIPANWREVPPGQMVLAKFAVTNAAGMADVTVTFFANEAGGPLANIDRWRGQLGLPKVDAANLDKAYTSLDVLGGKAMLVDVNGVKDGKETRLVGVILSRNGPTWFYKLMGDSAPAAREKEAFVKFVQSVKYND